MSKQDTDKLLENVRTELEASLEDIDASTQSRITQARHRALEKSASRNILHSWMLLGTVATACLVLLVFSLTPEPTTEPDAMQFEIDMLSNLDELELLEDLEFYEWLDEYELPT
ncbi:MAG: hypothetical protein GKR93_17050 [Gammaproteobacteria bacterium]|nr:hypothetical protein [Gammaproteobacteria bacterium]